jgi:hypothetical protein
MLLVIASDSEAIPASRHSLSFSGLIRDILVPRPSGAREVRPIRLSCRIVTQAIHGLRPLGERKVHPIRLSCRIVSTSPSAPRNDRLVNCAKASLSTDGSPLSPSGRNDKLSLTFCHLERSERSCLRSLPLVGTRISLLRFRPHPTDGSPLSHYVRNDTMDA